MKKYYVIKNEVVIDCFVGEGDVYPNYPFDHDCIVTSEMNAGIGWSFSGGTMSAPPPPEATEE